MERGKTFRTFIGVSIMPAINEAGWKEHLWESLRGSPLSLFFLLLLVNSFLLLLFLACLSFKFVSPMLMMLEKYIKLSFG